MTKYYLYLSGGRVQHILQLEIYRKTGTIQSVKITSMTVQDVQFLILMFCLSKEFSGIHNLYFLTKIYLYNFLHVYLFGIPNVCNLIL